MCKFGSAAIGVTTQEPRTESVHKKKVTLLTRMSGVHPLYDLFVTLALLPLLLGILLPALLPLSLLTFCLLSEQSHSLVLSLL